MGLVWFLARLLDRMCYRICWTDMAMGIHFRDWEKVQDSFQSSEELCFSGQGVCYCRKKRREE